MRKETTNFTFFRQADSVRYVCRAELWNPGPKRRVALFLEFRDAWCPNDAVEGEPCIPPSVTVSANGRAVTVRRGENPYQVCFGVEAPGHGTVVVEGMSWFRWERADCIPVDHSMGWKVSEDSAFSVDGAEREVVFRFAPPVSLMSVAGYADGAVFERGALTWRWRGKARGFDIGFDSLLEDENTEAFQGRYTLPLDYQWDHEYLGWTGSSCERDEIDFAGTEGVPDSLTSEMRTWVEDYRKEALSAVTQICARHGLTPPSSRPGAMQDLGADALAALNPVERSNLRFALALMPILDVSKRPTAILADMEKARTAVGR